MHSFQNPAYTLFKDAFQNLFKNLDTNKILKSLFTFRYGATDHNRPTGSVFHSSEIYELTVNKHALGTGSILVDYADNIDSYFEHQELQASRSCAEDGDPTFGILEDTSPTEQKILAFKTYKEHLDASPQEFEPDLSFNQDFLSLKR